VVAPAASSPPNRANQGWPAHRILQSRGLHHHRTTSGRVACGRDGAGATWSCAFRGVQGGRV